MPLSDLEPLLSGLWLEILNIENIDIDDDFFEIGATSIHIIIFIHKLQNSTGYSVGFDVLGDGATIRQVVRRLQMMYECGK